MIVSDPIADMLTRIRNANMAEKQSVRIPVSYTHLTLPTNREV